MRDSGSLLDNKMESFRLEKGGKRKNHWYLIANFKYVFIANVKVSRQKPMNKNQV